VRILKALQQARDAQAIAEVAITKAQGQITDIETSLDNVCSCLSSQAVPSDDIVVIIWILMVMMMMIGLLILEVTWLLSR